MHTKAGCNHGVLVDADGNILRAWAWYSTPECPHEFDVPEGGQIVALTRDEHDRVHASSHLYRYDFASEKVIEK